VCVCVCVCVCVHIYIHIFTYMYTYVGERRVLSLEYLDSPKAGSPEHGRSPPPLHVLDDLVNSSETFAPLRSTRHSPMLEEEEEGSHSGGGGGSTIAGLFKASAVEGEEDDLLGGLGVPDAGFAGGGFVQVPADEVGLGLADLGFALVFWVQV